MRSGGTWKTNSPRESDTASSFFALMGALSGRGSGVSVADACGNERPDGSNTDPATSPYERGTPLFFCARTADEDRSSSTSRRLMPLLFLFFLFFLLFVVIILVEIEVVVFLLLLVLVVIGRTEF